MIEFSQKYTDDLSGLDRFEELIKQQVLRAGAAGMAAVIYDEVRLNAEKLTKTENRQRKPRHIRIRDAVYRVYSAERSDDASKMYRVSWNRKKAPHGKLLEYGTSKAPAYPFLKPSFSRIHEAIANGLRVMTEKLQSLKT